MPRREKVVGLARRLSRGGNAELQRSRLFTTASAKSNSSDDDGEYDCTLHSIFSYVVLALPPALSERAA
jgi:hypothetical protein